MFVRLAETRNRRFLLCRVQAAFESIEVAPNIDYCFLLKQYIKRYMSVAPDHRVEVECRIRPKTSGGYAQIIGPEVVGVTFIEGIADSSRHDAPWRDDGAPQDFLRRGLRMAAHSFLDNTVSHVVARAACPNRKIQGGKVAPIVLAPNRAPWAASVANGFCPQPILKVKMALRTDETLAVAYSTMVFLFEL